MRKNNPAQHLSKTLALLSLLFLFGSATTSAESREYYGMMTISGEEIVPCTFVDIKPKGENFLLIPDTTPASDGSTGILVDKHGQRIEVADSQSKKVESGPRTDSLRPEALPRPRFRSADGDPVPELQVEPTYGTTYRFKDRKSVV